ncbi:MAG: copper resistance protein B [Rhodospirillales bacterium]|nr:copper resistance protein B [Rhodospirillales bacterium]MSP80462.1 copper resistance protein B [Rhodospirillales bacterium]
MNNKAIPLALGAALVSALAAGRAWAAEPGQIFTFFQAEQLEYRTGTGKDGLNWDAQGWVGNDDHKLWFKTEGEKPNEGKLEKGEFQLLYSRPISDFFDVQAGVRQDIKPNPDRTFAVFGVQGIAPYKIEIDAAAFVSHEGEVSARLKGEYDMLITQQLILQPTAEINLAVQSVKERDIGSGVNSVGVGLRLRYEIIREFAPYIGFQWERKLGQTADYARADRETVDNRSFVTGVRFWF